MVWNLSSLWFILPVLGCSYDLNMFFTRWLSWWEPCCVFFILRTWIYPYVIQYVCHYMIYVHIYYSIFILLFCLYHNLNSVIVNWDINAYVYLSPKKYKPTCLPPASLLSLSFTWEPNFMKKKSTVDVFTSLTLSFCFIPVWLPLHLFWKLLSQ